MRASGSTARNSIGPNNGGPTPIIAEQSVRGCMVLCVCVHTHTHMYMHAYICMYIYIDYAFMLTHTYLLLLSSRCVVAWWCVCAYIPIPHICTCIYMHAYIHWLHTDAYAHTPIIAQQSVRVWVLRVCVHTLLGVWRHTHMHRYVSIYTWTLHFDPCICTYLYWIHIFTPTHRCTGWRAHVCHTYKQVYY